MEASLAFKRILTPVLPVPWLAPAKRFYRRCRLGSARARLIQKPTDPRHLDILFDPAFQASVAETKPLTDADTAQLANLWQLCRLGGERGTIVEVGTYKGGTALHLSNCRPHAEIFVCDTFSGFASLALDPELDRREVEWRQRFGSGPFEDTSAAAVEALFRARGRRATVIAGRFPDSDAQGLVRDVGFAHIDVTVYPSCRDALEYLRPRSLPGAIWLVDSYGRQTDGVTRAVHDFVAAHPDWSPFPLYPGQAVLFDRERGGRATEDRKSPI